MVDAQRLTCTSNSVRQMDAQSDQADDVDKSAGRCGEDSSDGEELVVYDLSAFMAGV